MKERIDHSNYEAWLLDRLEGLLTADQERELAAFLLLHPELDPGAEELPSITRLQARMEAMDREALKRHLPPMAAVDDRNMDDHLVARLEGDLTSAQRDALVAYLILHPEHQRAEHLFALTKLVPEAMAFAHKQATCRALPPLGMPSHHTLDDFLVARLEGDLTFEQEAALTDYLATDAGAARNWALMQATRVHAAPVAFADKASLKKGGRVIAIGSSRPMVRLAAAASIALLLGMAWWALTRTETPKAQVAEGEKPAPVIAPAVADKDGMPALEQSPVNKLVATEAPGGTNTEVETPRVPRPHMVPDRNVPDAPLAQDPAPQPTPEVTAQPEVQPIPQQEESAVASVTPVVRTGVSQPAARTFGEALTGAVREQVLGQEPEPARAIDRDDAVAAVDAGLKAVAGERAGLSVERDAQGRRKRFDLRLGRHLAISASR